MNIGRKCAIFSVILFILIGFTQPTFAQNPTKAQTGKASWYGSKYHGKRTSSGERYNKHEMTAAHKTLPFGTLVKVTNLANNKSVVVRINDRGPFVGHRIIDVSEAAARKLKICGKGVGKVAIKVVDELVIETAFVEKLPSIQTAIGSTTIHQATELQVSALIKENATKDVLPVDLVSVPVQKHNSLFSGLKQHIETVKAFILSEEAGLQNS